jgi:hypothetical protein
MIRTEAVTEIALRFYSLNLRHHAPRPFSGMHGHGCGGAVVGGLPALLHELPHPGSLGGGHETRLASARSPGSPGSPACLPGCALRAAIGSPCLGGRTHCDPIAALSGPCLGCTGACTHRIVMIRTEAAAEIHLRFYSFHRVHSQPSPAELSSPAAAAAAAALMHTHTPRRRPSARIAWGPGEGAWCGAGGGAEHSCACLPLPRTPPPPPALQSAGCAGIRSRWRGASPRICRAAAAAAAAPRVSPVLVAWTGMGRRA